MMELQRNKLVKKDFSDRLYGQIFLSIPKHLLKISILIIIGSFIAMLYMINNDETWQDLLQTSEKMDFTHATIHPLFLHL